VCARLAGGRVIGIDRSATAIRRARERNAEQVASGRAELRQLDLAGLDVDGPRFDTIFAVNVNLFGVRADPSDLAAVRRLLRPGGRLHAVHETATEARSAGVAAAVAGVLGGAGFHTEITTGGSGTLVGVTARLVVDGPDRVPSPTGELHPVRRPGVRWPS
jgi:SAM-dependent methyltransferase